MIPTNTDDAVCVSDPKRVRRFKALLLTTFVVGSIGQVAFTLLRVFCDKGPGKNAAVFFTCWGVLAVSLIAQFSVLPVVTLCLASATTLKTKRARWVLYGVALLALQTVLFWIQIYQVDCWISITVNSPGGE